MYNLSNYESDLLRLAKEYSRDLERNPHVFLSMLCKKCSVQSVMLEVYKIMVAKKYCEVIEDIPEEEKQDLFKEAKKHNPSANKQEIINACMALQAFGNVIEIEVI